MTRGVRVTAVLVGFWSVMVPGMWVLAPSLVPHLLWVTALIGLVLMAESRTRFRGRGRREAMPDAGATVVDLAEYRGMRGSVIVAERRAA